MSQFIDAMHKGDTFTENGALSNSSTGSVFTDDFSNAGAYRGREWSEIEATMGKLWAADKLTTFKVTMYLRMVTRKVKMEDGATEKVQKGQGAKDEAIKRLLWIAYNDSDWFYQNLFLIPLMGSWRDLWQIMYFDYIGKKSLDRKKIYEYMTAYAAHNRTDNALFLKYLPLSKASSRLKTDRAKAINLFAVEFRKHIGTSPKQMRQLKSDGEAHAFQRAICSKRFDQLNFNTIPGKALAILTSGDFLKNHNLEKEYLKWLEKQPVAKFTGYPHELGVKLREASNFSMWNMRGASNIPQTLKMTLDKQFQGLLEKANKDQGSISGNVWTALDTSGSMGSQVRGLNGVTAFDICISMGIYFSSLNEGAFKDHVIMFDSNSKKLKLGGTFTEKYNQITTQSTAWGSTNFQSVIDEIVRIRKANPNIPVEDYPETLIVVSDMQFNPSGSNTTNYQRAMEKLKRVGLPPIKIVWWDVTGRKKDFPSTIDELGTYVFSGFDGAILTLLLGGEVNEQGVRVALTMEEAMHIALNQELMQHIIIPE